MTASAAQPDEAAGLVEKCARVLCADAFTCGVPCGHHQRVAQAVYDLLDPAIREQHGEQEQAVLDAAYRWLPLYDAPPSPESARATSELAAAVHRAAIAKGGTP